MRSKKRETLNLQRKRERREKEREEKKEAKKTEKEVWEK